MRVTLRVLIVEDSPDDTELVLRQLQRAGYDPVSERVETAEAMKVALERGAWDLVISDYAMRQFDAPAALNVLKQSGRDVPFIVVSGTIGEDVAVGMMTAGAQDYLTKGNLTRLAPAIERELREAVERRKRRLAEEGLRRLATAVDHAADTIVITDAAGTIQYVNPAFERTTGFTCAEAIGKNPRVLKSGHQDAASYRRLWETITSGGVWSGHFTNRRKDGTLYEEEATISPVRDNQGRISHFIAVKQDVTAQKRALVALAKSEQKYRVLFESSRDAIMTLSPPDWKFAAGNPATLKMFGAENDAEFLAHAPWELSPAIQPDGQDSARKAMEMIETALREGSNFFEWTHRRIGGEEFPADVLLTRMEQEGKVMLQANIRDVTERQRAQEALRESEDRYRSLVEESPEAIGIYQEHKLVFINSTGVRQLGAKTKEELLGMEGAQIIHPDDLADSMDRVRRRLAGETGLYPAEVRYLRRDGTTIPVEVVATPITFQGKAAMQFIARDITDRKRAEQQLRESAALYHSLVENLPQFVFRKDQTGHITFCNGLFCQALGKPLPEILGKTDPDLFPASLAAKYLQDDQHVLRTGRTFEGDEELRQSNGKTIIVHVVKTPLRDAFGQIIGVQGIAWDITEKKQLEAQALRSQRLESIGTLAGGVAHDLNNALAPVMMSVELLRLEFPDTSSHYLDMIQASAKRGAAMVKQLLTFAKGAEGERLLVQPRHLCKEMEKLIMSTFPKNIQLQTRYAADLRTILGDVTQLHQVLLNLCVNARDAMPEGGTLTLEVENTELDATHARVGPEAKPGSYVVCRVTDTGTGMPPEILERIFEPFFSTKGPDKGTGLGLSTALGIVKSHCGFVQACSTPGQGSTFAVYLPAYGSVNPDASLRTIADIDFRGHGEAILVVDDEAAVRDALRDVLTQLNFKVLTACDGSTALLQVAENPADLRVVVTDLHMPHMDGLSFARVLRARLPQTGILVTSGRMDEREATEFEKLGVSGVLQKPFTREKLVEALKPIFMKQLVEASPPLGNAITAS